MGPVNFEATKARVEELQRDKVRERKRHSKLIKKSQGGNRDPIPSTEEVPLKPGGNRDPIPSTEEVPLKPGGNRAKKRKRICTGENCGKQFTWTKEVEEHNKQAGHFVPPMSRGSRKRADCTSCGRNLLKENMKNHMKSHTAKPKPIVQSNQESMVAHMGTCTDCEISFNTQGDLRKHIEVTHMETCTVCGEAFFSKEDLNEHMDLSLIHI